MLSKLELGSRLSRGLSIQRGLIKVGNWSKDAIRKNLIAILASALRRIYVIFLYQAEAREGSVKPATTTSNNHTRFS